ncbi:hypothetical protein SNEBB_007369 [Seison nebaliae]|nr:hypothetical protein SNEBB_007369 [Seison nebaliae]
MVRQQSDVFSKNLGLTFKVTIQDETHPSAPKCHIMTIHDMGVDSRSFVHFVEHEDMKLLKERCIFVHVDLPGQEKGAHDLNIEKYPSFEEIATELIDVLTFHNINQVVVIGDGAGANIAARFAMTYNKRVVGICLIHPTGTVAGISETVKDKFNNWRLIKKGMNPGIEGYLLWHKFGIDAQRGNSDEQIELQMNEFSRQLYGERNPKNLALFIQAFRARKNVNERLTELKCDCLIAVGKKASVLHTSIHFYEALLESRRSNIKSTVNSPLLEVDGVGDVLSEGPSDLAQAFQFFLQGIGWIPAVPMAKNLGDFGKSRSMSTEEHPAD